MVYFVCRSEYEPPHGRRIIEYPDATDLADWFRAHWITREELIAIEPQIASEPDFDPWDWQDQIHDLREKAFGGGFYGLCELLVSMLDRSPPESLAEVESFVASFGGNYSEGTIALVDGAIQAHTDDDEIDIAWYLFDDRFVNQFPERASFLLHKQLDLPEESDSESWTPSIATKTIAAGDQATYAASFLARMEQLLRTSKGAAAFPHVSPILALGYAVSERAKVQTTWRGFYLRADTQTGLKKEYEPSKTGMGET